MDECKDCLDAYAKVAGQEAVDQLWQLAKPLKGFKLVHVNSTAKGGGVAEILEKMLPLTQHLGIDASWEIIEGNAGFYECTKKFHNALQGNKSVPSQAQLKIFEEVNFENAKRLKSKLDDADIVFIHDPQPIALIDSFPNRKGKWIWRCHIDASKPNRTVWNYLKKYIEKYDASIFSLAQFAHPLPIPMYIILPSIDPFSEKNVMIDEAEVSEVCELFGIDRTRPILLQVSRYDRFKDPLGVIEAYKFVKKFNAEVQLVLAGGGADDDPEGDIVYKEVKLASEDDPDIHLLSLPSDAHRTINALQRAADIIIQKSLKEGFGLTVTEALWKGKPVIGGNVGGIRSQVLNGYTGYLVNTPEGAAYRIRYLLQNEETMKKMGQNGKELVREKFLNTRHLREYLTLIYSLFFDKKERIEL